MAFLHRELDRMSDQLLAQRRRLEISQRLAAWQEVARAMAHELRNPLTAIKMGMARLSRVDPAGRGEADQARLSESLSLLEEQVEALMRMTQSFSEFARLPAMAPKPVQLRALMADVCALFREQGGAGVKLADGEEIALRADPDQLRRAFVNLLKNAVEAGGAGAPDVEVALRADRERALVVIRDHGAGIARQIRMGQFVEGGSQKPGGSGLGLPITQKILHEHGGSLRLDPAEGGGTVATVELPLAGEEAR
jgi:nitrogen fixation/metabolism regulation signal transduction histidine kinase